MMPSPGNIVLPQPGYWEFIVFSHIMWQNGFIVGNLSQSFSRNSLKGMLVRWWQFNGRGCIFFLFGFDVGQITLVASKNPDSFLLSSEWFHVFWVKVNLIFICRRLQKGCCSDESHCTLIFSSSISIYLRVLSQGFMALKYCVSICLKKEREESRHSTGPGREFVSNQFSATLLPLNHKWVATTFMYEHGALTQVSVEKYKLINLWYPVARPLASCHFFRV